jgi:hypothetical protein
MQIMTKGHDQVNRLLGTPLDISRTSPSRLQHMGAIQAMITMLNRFEKYHWGEADDRGFDYVLFDMKPHPSFFNLLAMMRYVHLIRQRLPIRKYHRGQLGNRDHSHWKPQCSSDLILSPCGPDLYSMQSLGVMLEQTIGNQLFKMTGQVCESRSISKAEPIRGTLGAALLNQ